MVHRHATRTRCPSNPSHIQPNLWEPRYQRVHRHISSPDLTRKYVKIEQPNNQLEVAIVSSYDSCANLFPIWLQDWLEEYHQGDWLWGDQTWLSWILKNCGKEHWIFAPCTSKIIRKGMVANIQHPQNRAAIGVMPLEETNKHYTETATST